MSVVELTWQDGRNAVIDPAKVCAIIVAKEAQWGRRWTCWLFLDGAQMNWSFKSEREARDRQNYLMVKLGWRP